MPEWLVVMLVVGTTMMVAGLIGGIIQWVGSVEQRIRALQDRR